MNRQFELTDPVKVEYLPNDIKVAIYDLSKKIAGDRWFIRICCLATLSLNDTLLGELSEDEEMTAAFKERYNNGISLNLVKERNFIDETVKDQVVQELLDQIYEHSLDYMKNQTFPLKLVKSKFDAFKKEYYYRKEMQVTDDNDEDDGPADFSACFKD